MVDRRGHGGSTGDPNSYGWGEYRDIAAAVAYLQGRNDVDPDRIGGLGFSVGGEVLLETAARTSGLQAVVAEGAGFRSIREFRHLGARAGSATPWSASPPSAPRCSPTARPPPDLVDLMSRTPPRPVLLIRAETGQGGEELALLYAAAAGDYGGAVAGTWQHARRGPRRRTRPVHTASHRLLRRRAPWPSTMTLRPGAGSEVTSDRVKLCRAIRGLDWPGWCDPTFLSACVRICRS